MLRVLQVGCLLFVVALPAAGQTSRSAESSSLATRLQKFEDKEEIQNLLLDYGRHLDNRDFAAYSSLFAKDGEWVGGFGTAAGGPAGIKAFMEATSKRWMEQKWADKLAAGFTNSGSINGDKQNTLVGIACFAAQHGMVWINLNLMPGNNTSAGSVEDLNRLGSFLGAMSQSNLDQGPEVAPTTADLETARRLGTSVAFVYEHADELGARRLTDSPRSRLRFDPEFIAARRVTDRTSPRLEPARRKPAPRRTRPEVELLPVGRKR